MPKKTTVLAAFLLLIVGAIYIMSRPSSDTAFHKAQEANYPMQDQTIIIEHGSGKPEHAIIWLHGLGASSNDFPPVIPYLRLNPDPAIRFVFPQAPDRPVTINGGMRMPAWYDIKGTKITDKEDLQGMTASRNTLEDLITEQINNGIPGEHIIIAGFSQGGAVAYYTGIRSKHKLAGILALSTYLPFVAQAADEHLEVNKQTPIFSNHGLQDTVVPIQIGKSSVEALQTLGFNVQWKTYAMGHEVSMEQLRDIGQWINQTFD